MFDSYCFEGELHHVTFSRFTWRGLEDKIAAITDVLYKGMSMFKKHKYVLVIEDSPDDQLLLSRALSKSNFSPDLLMLNDGEEALNYIGVAGRVPDVIMLDVKIPKHDGIEVLRAIRQSEKLKDVPVIMMTTSTMRRDIVAAYSAGASSFLIKHSDTLEWNRELNVALDYWLTINRTANSEDVA